MYKVSINGKSPLKTEITSAGSLLSGAINNQATEASIILTGEGQYHLIHNTKSYTVLIIKTDFEGKKLTLKLNGKKFNVEVKDKFDELLHNLGMDTISSKKVNEIKAPMPGMVLTILVSEGQEVKKGDSLLILEAMKMENVLKSPTDGVIKKVCALKGSAVEKNHLLIQF